MNSAKNKGSKFERDIVKLCEQYGILAKRAWGSDGRSMGMHQEVDLVIGEWKIQAKIRKRIAKWMIPNENVDAQVIREDRGVPYIVIRLEDYLDELSRIS